MMMRYFSTWPPRVLVTFIAVGPSVVHAGTSGFTDCTCIEPNFNAMDMPNRSQCSDPARPLPALVKGKVYCYPADYGSGSCKAWDIKLAPDCANSNGLTFPDPPKWCRDPWCYVNGATCGLTNSPSQVFSGVQGLHYSYATCGSIDSFQDSLLDDLAGKTLRVHALHEPPMVFADGSSKKGVVWDLYDKMFERAQVGEIVMKDLLPYNGSEWEACVHDVALGAIDLCMGTFWELPRRRAIVNFVAAVLLDNFYLVVKKVSVEPDTISQIFRVFDPFTPRLWLCLAVAIMVISMAIYFLEEANASDDHDDFPYDNKAQNVMESVYKGCMGFWSGGAAHAPKTMGSKVIMVAFGVFIVLTLAGYTANLASVLVVEVAASPMFENVDELLSAGGKICMWGSVEDYFLEQRPGVSSQIVGVSNTREAFEKLDSGECDGIVNGEGENSNWLKKKAHCDKMVAPSGALFSLMLSQPATPLVARVMSYWVQVLKQDLTTISANYAVTDECAAEETVDPADQKMDIDDFMGTFMITGAASAFGFLLAGLNCLFARTKRAVTERLHHHDAEQQAVEEMEEVVSEYDAARKDLDKQEQDLLDKVAQVERALQEHAEAVKSHKNANRWDV
eukprot:TRINITY_DN14786_c0_g1_i7.p1 TRINITY_DN14786_c0_g1~~TRINITY_DN14786_c0_g1_i7.p1  ORF type:complete len:619 (-),score=93.34 TRINITY_DN14786_c0_g1_i7:6-1862(-)